MAIALSALACGLPMGCSLFTTASGPAARWQKYYDAGKAAYQDERYTEAQRMFAAAVAEAETFGDQDERLGRSLNNLAAAYTVQGRYNEAEPLYRRSLAILEKSRGPTHPDLVICLENYAALLRETHRPAEAAKLEQRARAIEAGTADRGP